MIKSFRDNRTRWLFEGRRGDRKWQSFEKVARRKLLMLDAAESLQDLKAPPNNRLEALVRDRTGQHAIRINDQYRVCFIWEDGHAWQVEIEDYH
jgi:proteic killer suppression protein